MNPDFYTAFDKDESDQTQWQLAADQKGPVITGHAEGSIDLNEQLVKNRPATFFMRVNSKAMAGAGIFPGDVVIVDRSLEPKSGKIIIALLDGELLIRKYEVHNFKKRLIPATKKLAPIEISESSAFSVWGVITYVIHSL
jgi:DNA polymerase V